MDLRSGYPYWLMSHGLLYSYPSLQRNTAADIVVIGAGISGALVAWQLCQQGYKTIIIDRRHVGMGSSAASTGLLQYELDVPLHVLIQKAGKEAATSSYLLCRQSIYDLREICTQINGKNAFALKPSFQYASYKKDIPGLKKELAARKEIGINAEWMNKSEIEACYSFSKEAGLFSPDGGMIDTYLFTHLLLQHAMKKDLQVFDHTEVTAIKHQKSSIRLDTSLGYSIRCGKLVIACGYESQRYIPKKIQQLHSTYVIASERLPAKLPYWYGDSMIWETAFPYLYIRTTADNRILVGGKDVALSDPVKRDRLINIKSKQLEMAFNKLMPHIAFRIDFRWAGNFAGTKDGLPYIGSIPQHPHTYFALGFGGNGITFSVVAAQLICDMISGKKNRYSRLFRFDR